MPDKNHHPNCPRCKGEGYYLNREGRGYYRDGSFGHNDWKDCTCSPDTPIEHLPAAVDPRPKADRFPGYVPKSPKEAGAMWLHWLVHRVKDAITAGTYKSVKVAIICRTKDGREFAPFSIEHRGDQIILCENEETE